MSLDEAYLDVTENLKGMEIATEIALEIRAKIKQATGAQCLGRDFLQQDPGKNGERPQQAEWSGGNHAEEWVGLRRGLAGQEVPRRWPRDRRTAQKHGIETGLDLKSKSLAFLQEHFGKSGPHFYGIARGIDDRQVRPDRIRKSVGAEDTFSEDISNLELATAELKPLAEKVWGYCEKNGISGKTVTVKIKYSDFSQATRSRTVHDPSRQCLMCSMLPGICWPASILFGGPCACSE